MKSFIKFFSGIRGMMDEIVVFAVLAVAAYADLRTREVPDWLNYGLISAGLGFALIKSIVFWDYWLLVYSLAGLAVFVGLAYLMFYTAQWGGGDSKLLMGLGAMFGFKFSLSAPFVDFGQMIAAFLVNLLFVAVVYGFLWSVGLAVVKRKLFVPKFAEYLRRFRMARFAVLGLAVLGLFFLFFSDNFYVKFSVASLVLIGFTTFYLWLFVKSVENSCMFKRVSPEELTEGDWVAEDIIAGKRRVCSKKDLGISREQIDALLGLKKQGKIKKVLIKEGIPFVPSFLIAFIISFLFGNVILFFV